MRIRPLCIAIWILSLVPLLAIEDARKEVYKTVDDVELAVHVFEPEGHQRTDRRPAAIFFFGGGWVGGTPEQFVPHARHLADRGMVALVADYRTAKKHKTTPFECVEDAKSAMRWLRAHAQGMGIDPDRLVAGGGSAGGHLAAATATLSEFNDNRDDLSVSPVPQALLLFNPVYDNGPEGYGHDRVQTKWQAFSPMHNIRKGMPPTVVFLGTKDPLIPVATAEAFQAKMRDVGSRSELHLYEGQKHGFFNQSNSPKHYQQTVAAMDAFLVSIGFLKSVAQH